MRSLFLLLPVLLLVWQCSSPGEVGSPQAHAGTDQLWDPAKKPFFHGVASGDPLPDRVIIWTRVTPDRPGPVDVAWQVGTDPDLSDPVATGNAVTGPDRDYTVKVDVQGLDPATTYYYRFSALNSSSPAGRTRTAAAGAVDRLRFAVVSCSNYEAGYFNAFADLARRDDLDAVIHLGDYIYEYGPGTYGDTTLDRKHLPPREIVSLDDYRTRYAQYRLDPDFQAAHGQHPFITIWDDHEITNNSYETGAQNHQPGEGDYMVRRAAARQAYYEWLPVRPNAEETLYRTFSFGPLAELIMLDERLAGRSPQAESMEQEDYASPERSMLGPEQKAWFLEQLAGSEARWKIVGNQVIFSELDLSMFRPESPRNLDAWDGYPAEKEQIIRHIRENDIENIVFITGDTHASWALEVPVSIADYQRAPDQARVAVEYGTTSISSANWDEGRPLDTVLRAEQMFLSSGHNPHLKFTNLHDHGYMLLDLDGERARAEWHYVERLDAPDENLEHGMSAETPARTQTVRMLPPATQ